MAGSRRWFVYTLDDGTNVSLNGDESNIEAVNGTAAVDPPVANRPPRQIPNGVTPRYVVYASADGTRKLKIPVLNVVIYNSLPASVPTIPNPFGTVVGTGGGILSFERKGPEKIRPAKFGVDTGINDGDTP
jgi:hypothetical protein